MLADDIRKHRMIQAASVVEKSDSCNDAFAVGLPHHHTPMVQMERVVEGVETPTLALTMRWGLGAYVVMLRV